MTARYEILACTLLAALVGCASSDSELGTFRPDSSTGVPDASPDAAPGADAGTADGGGELDAGADAGGEPDSGVVIPGDVAAIGTGFNSTCALKQDGAVLCWGNNDFGQLGTGTSDAELTPVPVGGDMGDITDGTALAVGGRHACALRASGVAVCWGQNAFGQLGDGTLEDRTSPVAVTGLPSGVVELAAGGYHTCARTDAGAVWCWGNENGDISGERRTSPVQVTGLTDAKQLLAGAELTCALREGGGVACWGSNSDGQLGNGSTTSSTSPVAVSGITDATDLAVGATHACVVRSTGAASCWGQNFYGQVGDGVEGEPGMRRTTPVSVVGSGTLRSIFGGFGSTCAIRSDDQALCWGSNSAGQLGDGYTANRSLPNPVVSLPDAVVLSRGMGSHFCAIRSTGDVVCWGANSSGQLGDGTTENRSTHVTLAL